jgi:membrane protein implicated in regulation of membrane protease activity
VGAGVDSGTTSTTSVDFAAAFLAGAFFAAAFFAAVFLAGFSVSSSVDFAAAFFGAAFFAAFLTGFASAGCSSRINPSRSARRRTRSACCSMTVDDWVLTAIPNLPQRSSIS